jgi:iron only hydrogenase large subunit-like protein/uncharacterized Fe-S cluster-containing protein
MKSRYIRLVEAQCHNCMKCVRVCPTDAMTYINHEPTIAAEECILCGRCYVACPHEAKSLISELEQVEEWLAAKEQVILSVAPSFTAVWPKFRSLERILEGRGFSFVEETARGAAAVSRAYADLIEAGEMKNIISTACPAVNSLIEKEYGDLTDFMAPVVPPLIAHGRLIKQKYPQAKVVFLSPCIAKYREIEDARFAGAVDACLGMEEVVEWVKADLSEEEQEDWSEFEGSIARLYPMSGGILQTLPHSDHYKYIAIDGVGRIRTMLESLRRGEMKNCFFEVNACRGGCLGGPLLSHFTHNEFVGQERILESVDGTRKITPGPLPCDLSAQWHKEEIPRITHSEEEIREEMIREGKTGPEKIHDCGACGYDTCRLKAIAVLDGKADPKVCLPEALERATSLSNVVIENTQNGIIVLDQNLKVREMNPAARSVLGYEMVNPTGMPLEAVLPGQELTKKISAMGRKSETMRLFFDVYQKLFDLAIVRVQSQNLFVITLMDRTDEEAREKMLRKMREETMTVTQQVLDDQMRSVQEIASLLGETTAKGKVALTNLRRVMSEGSTGEDSHE